MPVSGLVLTLAPTPDSARALFDLLQADRRVTLGEPIEAKLPLVTETETLQEHDDLWGTLEGLDGVLLVELAYHDFSDVEDFDEPLRPRFRPRGG